jgi:shikimate dehydrogenase
MSGNAFVIGSPIAHSRSPLIHGYWLAEHGIAGSYRAVEVAPADLPAFIAALREETSDFIGGNITIPHKERALELVDIVDETALSIGAINTIWRVGGKLHATNTDAYGFLANLDAREPGWDRQAPSSAAVVLGAGGASRAVLSALVTRGFHSIHLVNRTIDRAEGLAASFGPRVTAHGLDDLPDVLRGAGLFVNSSSAGMDGAAAVEIDVAVMRADAVVTDIVYAPLETPFLAQGKAAGLRTVDGLGMLLHQAVPGFERWFGTRPAVTDRLRALVIADLERGH